MHRGVRVLGGQKGFTLVETLIVVAIIVVLAATLFPVFEAATRKAESAVCLSNIRNLAVGAALYADDNDGRCISACMPGPTPTTGVSWEVALNPYLRSTHLFLCPNDATPNPSQGCISFTHSYGINYDIALVGGYNGNSLFLSQIQRPTETILFFDLRGAARTMGASYAAHRLSRVEARHGDGANFVFVAGNAVWKRVEQTAPGAAGPADTGMWAP